MDSSQNHQARDAGLALARAGILDDLDPTGFMEPVGVFACPLSAAVFFLGPAAVLRIDLPSLFPARL